MLADVPELQAVVAFRECEGALLRQECRRDTRLLRMAAHLSRTRVAYDAYHSAAFVRHTTHHSPFGRLPFGVHDVTLPRLLAQYRYAPPSGSSWMKRWMILGVLTGVLSITPLVLLPIAFS